MPPLGNSDFIKNLIELKYIFLRDVSDTMTTFGEQTLDDLYYYMITLHSEHVARKNEEIKKQNAEIEYERAKAGRKR